MRFILLFALLGLLNITSAQDFNVTHLGSHHTNAFDESAAEIAYYDKDGQKIFYSNAFANAVGVLDVSDPTNPTLVNTIDCSPYGGGVNSLVVWDGFVAVAVEDANKQANGRIVFFDTAGVFVNQVTVGALPDMVGISPDKTKLVVANEGEPSDDYTIDPIGSVSIIDIATNPIASLSASDVTSATFSNFERMRQSFESGPLDNWNYTLTPATYNTESDSAIGGNEDVWAVIEKFTSNINNAAHGNLFFGGQDLENGNGGGDFQHTIDFDPVDLSTRPQNAWVSFEYYTKGYDPSDSAGYVVEYDNGSTWDMTNYVALNKDTNWNKVTIAVPTGSSHVRLRLMAKQNGSSDYIGFDNIQLNFFDESVNIYGNNDKQTVEQDLEPEYVCIDAASAFAFVALQENNAFAKVDLSTGEVVEIKGLGYKDHSAAGNGFDASNTAADVNIRNWPVKGMFQPDAFSCFNAAGTDYFIMANEGDSRDYDSYSEEERVKDLTLDSIAFPNYANLQLKDSLGRLKITLSKGDIDHDGEFEELYSYGARSFSILDSQGNMIFDSGDDFEVITDTILTTNFNSTNDDNTSFKNRSDDKGPEPEGLTVGKIHDKTYAFIGLERVGGVMCYDISDPINPVFKHYFNRRDFSQAEADSAALDLGPEDLKFIPDSISPNGKNLLVVSNEVSGTISIFQIDVPDPLEATLAGNDAVCFDQDNGTATATVTGGITPYSYNWNNGGTTATIDNLAPGTYVCTITDSIGVVTIDSVLIVEPNAITSASSITNVSCNGDANGTATLTTNGGTGTLSEDWGTADPNALVAGTHVYTVTDANGCLLTDSVTITEPTAITLTETNVAESSAGNDGSIDLTVSGGTVTTSYTFLWNNGANTEDLSGVTGGTYTVTVTDNNGCTETLTVVLNSSVDVASNEVIPAKIYPTVVTNQVIVEWAEANGMVRIINSNGALAKQQTISNSVERIDVAGLAKGVYLVQLFTPNGMLQQRIIK